MPNELDTHDDNWQDLLKLEDDKVTTLNDAYLDNVILNDWLDKSEDSIDYMRFKLNETAKICLTVNADKNLKYTLYRYANGVLETIQTGSLSKNGKVKLDDGSWEYPDWDYSATTKAYLLQPGEFFVSVQAKDKTIDSNYDVELNGAKSAFFAGRDDHGDDEWQAIHEAEESDYDLGTIKEVEEGDALTDGWVGYGDAIAWRKFTLEKTARMRFNVHADDSSVFTLWRFNTDTKELESVLTAKPKKAKKINGDELDYALTVRTDRKVLNPGEYYISMESTNADTGGSAEFRVDFDPDCLIFAKGNNEDDTLEAVENDETGVYRLTNPEIWNEWVGCGDEYDYRVFRLDCAARISFTINSSDNVKLTVFEIAQKPNGNPYRKQILSVSPGKTQKYWDPDMEDWEYPEWDYSKNTKGKLFDKEKDYYICVQSTNATTGGSADYSLEISDRRDFTQSNDIYNDWGDLKDNGDDSTLYDDAGTLVLGMSRVLSGWVGYGDELDYCKFSLGSRAKVKFQINASEKVKFTIYRLTGIPGHYALKQVQTSTTAKTKIYRDEYGDLVEPDWAYSSKTAAKTLAAGDYYICVKNPDAAKGGDADYEVNFLSDDSKFYDTIAYNKVYGPEQKSPDDGINNWLYDRKTKNFNQYVTDQDGSIALDENTAEIVLDNGELSFEHNGTVFHNFVGHGDECDFAKVTLTTAARLVFNIDSTDAAQFSVYQNVKGIYEMKTIQTSSLLLNQETNGFHVTTPGVLLETGDYFISMQSQNADIGGSAYYNVTLDQTQSVFFTKADDGSNNFYNPYHSNNIGVLDGTQDVLTESWVGYGDEIDYYGFSLNSSAAKLGFTIQTTDDVIFSVSSVGLNKKGVYALTELLTTTIQVKGEGMIVSTKMLAMKEGEYCFSVKSANASRGGSADYTVRLSEMSSFISNACALDMPETSDALAMTDSLSFGQHNTDAIAGASFTSSLADLDDKSGWQSLLA